MGWMEAEGGEEVAEQDLEGLPRMPRLSSVTGWTSPLPPAGSPVLDLPTRCDRWMQGDCRFGDRCNFAHGETELRAGHDQDGGGRGYGRGRGYDAYGGRGPAPGRGYGQPGGVSPLGSQLDIFPAKTIARLHDCISQPDLDISLI